MAETLFVVRLWDGMDGEWMDLCHPCPKEEADALWRKKTGNGTHHTSYDDIDYYQVFPAETQMMMSHPAARWQNGGVLDLSPAAPGPGKERQP